MLQVRLNARRVQWFVVTKEGQVPRVVFKMSLRFGARVINKQACQRIQSLTRTLSFSELTTSFLISFILASRTAAFVTLLSPSSMR